MPKINSEELFLYWIRERLSIKKKKDNGDPKPWTEDPILQKYKFCNVRRMDDRVSDWLVKNWYTPRDIPSATFLTAATLARQLNNIDSLSEVGFPMRWDPCRYKGILEDRQNRGLTNFSAAYMITGTLGGSKVEQIVDKVVTPIHKYRKEIWQQAGKGQSIEQLWRVLLNFAGFSSFIAGQVTADLRHAIDAPWEDKDVWAPIGPGSVRGLNRLLNRELHQIVRQPEFDSTLPNIISMVKSNVEGTEHLEAIDVQNCLCEYDKYMRTLSGEGRPKQKYPGAA